MPLLLPTHGSRTWLNSTWTGAIKLVVSNLVAGFQKWVKIVDLWLAIVKQLSEEEKCLASFFFIFFLWALHGKSCFYGFCNPGRTVCPLPSAWCLCSSVWCCLSEDAHWELSLNFTYSKYYLLSLSKERQDCCFLLTVLQLSSFLLLLLLHRSLLVTGVLLGEVKVAIPATLKSKIRKLGDSYLRDSYLKSWFTVLSCWTVCSCPDAFTVFALFFFFAMYIEVGRS